MCAAAGSGELESEGGEALGGGGRAAAAEAQWRTLQHLLSAASQARQRREWRGAMEAFVASLAVCGEIEDVACTHARVTGGWQCMVCWLGQEVAGAVRCGPEEAEDSAYQQAFGYYTKVFDRALEAALLGQRS